MNICVRPLRYDRDLLFTQKRFGSTKTVVCTDFPADGTVIDDVVLSLSVKVHGN